MNTGLAPSAGDPILIKVRAINEYTVVGTTEGTLSDSNVASIEY